MLELKNFFEKVVQFVQLNNLDENIDETRYSETEGLYGEAETKANVDGFNGKDSDVFSPTDDELKAYEEWKVLKELKQDLTTSLSSLYASGQISEELSDAIASVLSFDVDAISLQELQDMIESEELTECESSTLSTSDEIEEYLSTLTLSSKDAILEQIGGVSEIDSIVVYENGVTKINTKEDGSAFTMFSSGKYVATYDDSKRTGFDTYDENGNLTNSVYVDHMRNDAVIQESVSYNEDGSSARVILNSNEPNVRQTVSVSCEKEITQIKTENVETGDVTINFQSESYTEMSSDSVSSNISNLQTDLDSSNQELSELQAEQQTVSEDLSTQQNCFASTESEKNSELSSIDSDISCGQSDLSDANSNLSDATSTLDASQEECNQASSAVCDSQQNANQCNSELNTACQEANQSQANANCAGEAKNAADNEASVAAADNAQANADLGNATAAADAADVEHAGAATDLADATVEEANAFSTLNQISNKKAAAQREYEAAKAKESVWEKIKNFVSSLLDKVKDLVNQENAAQRDADAATREREQAQTKEEQAAQALQERREEQNDAQELADAALRVYELKSEDAEVASQEYADALLDLADALVRRDDAEDEYDNALQQLMEKKGWQADAEGNLLNAQGEVMTCEEVCRELETFINDLYVMREDTSEAFDSTLSAIVDVINGDEVQLEEINEKITALQEEIANKAEELAMQEELLAQLEASQASVDAEKGAAGIVDDFFALFGGSYAGDEKEIEAQRTILLDAIINNDPAKTQEAYRIMHSDDEFVVDENGNIIDTASLTEEEMLELQALMGTENGPRVATLAELSDEQVQNIYDAEKTEIGYSVQIVSAISNGSFVCDGHEVELDDIRNALISQVENMQNDMTNAVERQGWLSTTLGYANDLFGIGTSESEAQAQIDVYNNLIQQLNCCDDPVKFAALFKEITGQNFDNYSVGTLLAYNKAAGIEPAGEAVDDNANKQDFTQVANLLSDSLTDAGLDPEALSMTSGSKAAEGIQEYIQTQAAITDGVIAVVDSVVVTLAVAAAPFTGGASLALGAAVGAGTNLLLNGSNSIYDADGDGSVDFNYTAKEAVVDGAVGALNGIVSVGANGLGNATSRFLSSSASNALAGRTVSQFTQKALCTYIPRYLGAAVEGSISGGAGAGATYLGEVAMGEREFSAEEFAAVTRQGAGAGAITNVGITALGDVANGARNALFPHQGTDLMPVNTPNGNAPDLDGTVPALDAPDEIPLLGGDDIGAGPAQNANAPFEQAGGANRLGVDADIPNNTAGAVKTPEQMAQGAYDEVFAQQVANGVSEDLATKRAQEAYNQVVHASDSVAQYNQSIEDAQNLLDRVNSGEQVTPKEIRAIRRMLHTDNYVRALELGFLTEEQFKLAEQLFAQIGQ